MPEEVKKSGGKGLLIGLIVLLLAGNILQFVLGHLKDEEQDELITTQQSSLDSLNKEKTVFLAKITQLETDLEQAIKDKEALGIDVEGLKEDLSKLRKDKAYYSANFIKPSVRKEMEAKIANYSVMLNQQNEEIRVLKAKNDSLYKNTVLLKEVIVQKQDTINGLEKTKKEQQEELDKGRTLKASNFSVTAIKSPDKNKSKYEVSQIYKDKDIVQMQLNFDIGSNPIAFIEEKAVFVQVLSPSKEVIHDMAKGGGKFQAEGKDQIYSVKQNIMYNRDAKKMSLILDKPAPLALGTHTVKVWCEGKMIGTGSFTIK